MCTKGRARQLRVAGSEAQGIEQQRVVGHVGVHAPLAQSIQGFLVRLELLYDGLGRVLRQNRGPRGARLRGDLLAGQIVVRLDRLVVRLDQHPGLRGVVGTCERDLLGAGRGDGVGGEHHVHLVVDEYLFACGRGHLRELVLAAIAQDVAREELGQTCIEAADLAVFLVEQREEVRSLRAAQTQSAGLLDLAGPGARANGRRVGDGALRHQCVKRRCIDGRALCEKRPTGHDRQCRYGGFQDGWDRHAFLLDGVRCR